VFSIHTASSGTLGQRLTVLADGNVGLGTTGPGAKLDVLDNDIAMIVGADASSATTRTNATTKNGYFAGYHYTNAEEPMNIIGYSADSTTNGVFIGGSNSTMNAATSINFYTAANNTTVTGTQRMVIDSSGNVGIGNASPKSKLHVGSYYMVGEKNGVTINDTWSTVLTVTLPGNHRSVDMTLEFGGRDWGNHSAPNFKAELVLKDGAGGYGEPGTVRYQRYWEPNTNDYIEARLTHGGGDIVNVQLRTNANGDGFLGGAGYETTTQDLTYRIEGAVNSIQ
jgi:hypothetical protein